MNVIQFGRLMRTIYSANGPDLKLIQDLGLLAVKIGQTYALRFDFLPEENCRQLSTLYQRADSVPPEVVEKILGEAYGSGWRERFRVIERQPLATASVGQVHRAELRDGRRAVIKVIKGDLAADFRRDVSSLRRLMRVAVTLYPKLERVADPVGILDSIEKSTLDELDLTAELRGQKILRGIQSLYGDHFELERLAFPEIYEEHSSSRVMVSEELTGPTFDDLLRANALDYSAMLALYQLHGFYMFRVGVFHGDLHPGNVILQDGKIYLLDTGAIGTVSKRLSNGLLSFFEGLSEYDFDAAAFALNGMAEEPIAGNDYRHFRRDFLGLYRDFKGASVSEVSLTKKMMQTIKLGVHSGMRFEKGMYPVIKSLMYLDGMVLRCSPGAQPIRDMRPMIDSLKKPLTRSTESSLPASQLAIVS